MLGKACCHDPKTREQDVPIIAKAKRNEAKNMGITRPKQSIKSAPFARSDKPERVSKLMPPRRQLYQEMT